MLRRSVLLWFVVAVLVSSSTAAALSTNTSFFSEEERLLHDLFENYNPEVRPAVDAGKPIQVGLGMVLHQILNVDLLNGVVTMSVWLRAGWPDPRLDWKASDYGGLGSVNVDISKVWLPDYLAYNSVQRFEKEIRHDDTRVILYSDGWGVFWGRPAVVKVSCAMSALSFPFDTQHCSLDMGSWSYSGFYQNFTMYQYTVADPSTGSGTQRITDGRMDLAVLVPNAEFSISTEAADWTEFFYACCPGEPWPLIKFKFSLERKPNFYVNSLLIPAAATTFASFLTFILPADGGERVGLAVTTTLVIVALSFVSKDLIPVTSESTVLGTFFAGCFAFSLMSLMVTVGVIALATQTFDADGDGHLGSHPIRWFLGFRPRTAVAMAFKIDRFCLAVFPAAFIAFVITQLHPHWSAAAEFGVVVAVFVTVTALFVLVTAVVYFIRWYRGENFNLRLMLVGPPPFTAPNMRGAPSKGSDRGVTPDIDRLATIPTVGGGSTVGALDYLPPVSVMNNQTDGPDLRRRRTTHQLASPGFAGFKQLPDGSFVPVVDPSSKDSGGGGSGSGAALATALGGSPSRRRGLPASRRGKRTVESKTSPDLPQPPAPNAVNLMQWQDNPLRGPSDGSISNGGVDNTSSDGGSTTSSGSEDGEAAV